MRSIPGEPEQDLAGADRDCLRGTTYFFKKTTDVKVAQDVWGQ